MNEDEGEAIPAPSTRPQPLPPWRERLPPVDDLVKWGTVASAGLYGILFLAYRGYYDAVDINPEDVGVTNSFILARVFGFILITLILGAIVVSYLFITSGFNPGPKTPTDRLRSTAIYVLVFLLSAYFSYFFPLFNPLVQFLSFMVVLIIIAIVLNHMKRSSLAPYWRAAVFIVALLLSVAIPSIAVVQQAVQLGQRARAGQQVTSINVLKIPIVDVSAPNVELYWANPTIPPPPGLFVHEPAKGVLLGQGNNVVIACVQVGNQHRVVRLNAGGVVVEFPP